MSDDFEIENGILKKYRGNSSNVMIPEGVTEIGSSAFRASWTIESVCIPEGVVAIGNLAFMHSGIESVSINKATGRVLSSACFFCL